MIINARDIRIKSFNKNNQLPFPFFSHHFKILLYNKEQFLLLISHR